MPGEEKGNSRTWMLLLYPDNAEHKKVMDETLPESEWDYVGIAHTEEGKLHHHIVVILKDTWKLENVANKLELDKRWLRCWNSKKKAMRYLCHRDNKEKYQYSTEGLYGPLTDKAIAECNRGDAMDETLGVLKVMQIIEEWHGYMRVTDLLSCCCAEGVYSHYRRLGNSIFKLLEEHNSAYGDKLNGRRATHD